MQIHDMKAPRRMFLVQKQFLENVYTCLNEYTHQKSREPTNLINCPQIYSASVTARHSIITFGLGQI